MRRHTIVVLGSVLLVAVLAVLISACSNNSEDIQPAKDRQHSPWVVLLCKAHDVTTEPHDRDFYAKMLTEAGKGLGLVYDFWLNASYGAIDLDGSTIAGWYTMTTTKAQLDPGVRNNAHPDNKRDKTAQECLDAAAAAGQPVDVAKYPRVITIINVDTDSGQTGTYIPAGIYHQFPSFFEHEMGHVYGVNHARILPPDTGGDHTWSTTSTDDGYGDWWDVMGDYQKYGYHSGPSGFDDPFGGNGPELGAVHRDMLNWMPSDRIVTYRGTGKMTVLLAPVNTPLAVGTLLVKIPVDSEKYYAVEYRHQSGWDQNIPHNAVLIHSVVVGDTYTYLVTRPNSAAWLPGQVFQDTANKVRISIDTFSESNAQITISDDVSTIPGPGTGGDENCDPHCIPVVAITDPSSALALVGTPITFIGTVANALGGTIDDKAIIWMVDGKPAGTGKTLTTSFASTGPHAVRLQATNILGFTGSDQKFLQICDASCTPQVRIDAPKENSHVRADIAITVAGSYNTPAGIAIAPLDAVWTVNGTIKGYGTTLTTILYTPGTYLFTLKVTNALGQSGSANITIIADTPPPLPGVSIVSPVDGQSYTDVPGSGQAVTLTASGSAGIVSYVWTDSTGGPVITLGTGASVDVTLSMPDAKNCAITTHTITVTATDISGQKATATITVILKATCIR